MFAHLYLHKTLLALCVSCLCARAAERVYSIRDECKHEYEFCVNLYGG